METLDKRNILYYLSFLQNLNHLPMQQGKLIKYIYGKCLNFLCLVNYYLLAHINITYKNFMPRSLGLDVIYGRKIIHLRFRFFYVKFTNCTINRTSRLRIFYFGIKLPLRLRVIKDIEKFGQFFSDSVILKK